MKKIEELYDDFIQSPEYAKIVNEIGIDKSDFAMLDEIEDLVGKRTYKKLETVMGTISVNREYFGFANGFRLAMQIMTDCVPESVNQKVGGIE